jgi:CheY-like chemotaxis protein
VSTSKKAALEYRLADGLPSVEADATQLRQVVLNLITNASEAIGEGKGVISGVTGTMECDRACLAETQFGAALTPGSYVHFEVSDTGCGMDEWTRGRLFEPFFTTKFAGRGLGLAAVLGIVRSHLGTIRIASSPGQGATFRVLLPGHPGPAPAVDRPAGPALAWRGTGTVLLVDDEAAVREVGRQMLEAIGFAVLTAGDGEEALEVLRGAGAEVSCVILDLTLPRKDGVGTLRELRAAGATVSVILSSGLSQHDPGARVPAGAVAGFVQKPYRLAELVAALRDALPGGAGASP